ncbi:unnamed protein product [Rotaria socialis]|uniref:F-box domain-containing protein n=1 Tax=Rotaria socialis TaxID=392032 RepID=A0A818TEJ9_9BILA|nr:unnamed protein product [Rotaria socialis]CAF4827267.1 unnamed protein product [Rotaria socialis]
MMALKQTMVTTLEHLSVELFHEIFIYFQLHEVLYIFSNLNSRFAAIMDNLSLIPIYLGLNGMNIAVTKFYYTHLSQSNTSSRLTSLCVSDTLAIDNGLWLAEHLSTFINLRHLSLIDIKRSSFELILNSLSIVINSLIMFSVRFSTEDRAAYTFTGVPEGVYYERIFHLFPSLRICHLFFWPYIHSILDSQLVLPPDKTFMPVQISLLNLQSLAVCCSPNFLSHLFEHLPQLEQLNYTQTTPWLPEKHLLRHSDHNRVTPINKHLAPNLCHLTIKWSDSMMNLESINELFERDVLFSLMKFRLLAWVAGPDVLHNLQSMLYSQCLYSFDAIWSVRTVVSLSETSKILFDTFQQLKELAPIELELSLQENMYSIRALTVPRMDKCLCVDLYLHKNTVHGRTPWSYNGCTFNNQWLHCNRIRMSEDYDRINEEFLSFSPPIVLWHQVTSLSITEPFNRNHLHLLFSQATNLRTLELRYRAEYDCKAYLKQETLIDLLNDSSLCNMLMSNGLRQLNLFTVWQQLNLLNVAYLIVEQLPHLQIIELHGGAREFIEMSHILMSGLSKLHFLTLHGILQHAELYDKKLRDLQNSNTRSFRTEGSNTINDDILFIWL